MQDDTPEVVQCLLYTHGQNINAPVVSSQLDHDPLDDQPTFSFGLAGPDEEAQSTTAVKDNSEPEEPVTYRPRRTYRCGRLAKQDYEAATMRKFRERQRTLDFRHHVSPQTTTSSSMVLPTIYGNDFEIRKHKIHEGQPSIHGHQHELHSTLVTPVHEHRLRNKVQQQTAKSFFAEQKKHLVEQNPKKWTK
jgi:hypothetical protein